MKKISGSLVILLLMSLAFIPGCTNYLYPSLSKPEVIAKTNVAQGKVVDLSDNEFSPLSEAQLQEVLEANMISPLAVEDIGNYTVVLYKNEVKTGNVLEKIFMPKGIRNQIRTIRLSSDQEGNIIDGGGGGFGDNSDNVPVSVGASSSQSDIGYVGFANVIINDSDVLKNAYKVECYYNNNLTTTTLVENQRAFIIPFPQEKVELTNVVVSDKDGRVLFNNRELLKRGIN